MKKLLCSSICALILSIGAFAQATETFDIATFRSPAGWAKRTSEASFQLSTEDKAKGTYCLINLFKSVAANGDAKKNFDAAWQTVVKTVVNVTAAPQMFASDNKEDWKAEGGFAPFEKDGEKGMAVLFTLSGYGKMVNILVLTNTMDYEPTITAFLESLSLEKLEAAKPQQAAENPLGSQSRLTLNNWKQSQNRKDAMGNYAGYSTNTYKFESDGAYTFSRVDFQNYTPKYYLEDEVGTYRITGNRITITPRKSTFSSHRIKKEDPPLKSGNLPRVTVQYSFEIVDVNGVMTLVLSPVDGTETQRDGQFSFWLNGAKTKSYAYSSVNAAGELIRQ
jgi:hypothetical protein